MSVMFPLKKEFKPLIQDYGIPMLEQSMKPLPRYKALPFTSTETRPYASKMYEDISDILKRAFSEAISKATASITPSSTLEDLLQVKQGRRLLSALAPYYQPLISAAGAVKQTTQPVLIQQALPQELFQRAATGILSLTRPFTTTAILPSAPEDQQLKLLQLRLAIPKVLGDLLGGATSPLAKDYQDILGYMVWNLAQAYGIPFGNTGTSKGKNEEVDIEDLHKLFAASSF